MSWALSCTHCTPMTVPKKKYNFAYDDNEREYLDKVDNLVQWCLANHLSLNVSKTKEMVIFQRRQQKIYNPLVISETPVERVSSLKYLTWTGL